MPFIPFLTSIFTTRGPTAQLWFITLNDGRHWVIFFLPLVPGFVPCHLLNSCYLRCNVPREHSGRCGWHPANSVESCNGAAALQQLWLWSHKSVLIRGRARSESKRLAPPPVGILTTCILSVHYWNCHFHSPQNTFSLTSFFFLFFTLCASIAKSKSGMFAFMFAIHI